MRAAAAAFASAAGDEFALFADFNARLGSVGSQALGTYDEEVENKNGAYVQTRPLKVAN